MLWRPESRRALRMPCQAHSCSGRSNAIRSERADCVDAKSVSVLQTSHVLFWPLEPHIACEVMGSGG